MIWMIWCTGPDRTQVFRWLVPGNQDAWGATLAAEFEEAQLQGTDEAWPVAICQSISSSSRQVLQSGLALILGIGNPGLTVEHSNLLEQNIRKKKRHGIHWDTLMQLQPSGLNLPTRLIARRDGSILRRGFGRPSWKALLATGMMVGWCIYHAVLMHFSCKMAPRCTNWKSMQKVKSHFVSGGRPEDLKLMYLMYLEFHPPSFSFFCQKCDLSWPALQVVFSETDVDWLGRSWKKAGHRVQLLHLSVKTVGT